jgi:mRNA-degrading endonuclease RelE of RelBE toxin-antitoxin system
MHTVVETPTFQKQVEKIWSESERMDFIDWIAENPLSGDVIPGAQGARKVRWSVAGRGKRGGVRVIYFNLTNQGVLILLMVYTKSEQSNLEPGEIRKAI